MTDLNESKLTLLQLKNYDNAYVNKELERMINQLDIESDRAKQEETSKLITASHKEYGQVYEAMTHQVFSMKESSSLYQVAIDKKERMRVKSSEQSLADRPPEKIMEKIAKELTQEIVREEKDPIKEHLKGSAVVKAKYKVGKVKT